MAKRGVKESWKSDFWAWLTVTPRANKTTVANNLTKSKKGLVWTANLPPLRRLSNGFFAKSWTFLAVACEAGTSRNRKLDGTNKTPEANGFRG
jgi:hypothetical protein